jgi:aminoglycoside phosphotransferase family enzyme/predicted kinase
MPPSAEPLPAGLAEALARAEAHPLDPSAADGVRHVQTHLSHVYLTGARAWKLRKAAALGFVDFSTRAERNADCVREVRLNRRLAPDVYLGVAPIEAVPGGGFRVGAVVAEPLAEAVERDPREQLVAMRRLPEGCDALALLERGALRAAHVDAVADRLARFHAAHGLGAPAPFAPDAWRARIEAPVRETLDLLAPAAGRLFPHATWQRVDARARAFLAAHADRFEARRRAGRIVDGHGDVHLQHVWFEPGRAEPILVDCIEFRDDLRQIDAAAEIAFLAMDLRYRGRTRLAERFLRRYAAAADDYDAYGVLDYFVSYRAAVRAKVAAIAADDAGIDAGQRAAAATSAGRHLALAARALDPLRGGALAVVTGLVGSGKSSVAEALADAVGGVVIASDRVRKALAGVAPEARGGAARGLYADAAKERVYEALLARAEPVVASGRVAILDATYALERHRAAAFAWADRRRAPAALFEVRCARDTALARLARRSGVGTDPSDAGPELLAWSEAHYEPPRAEPGLGSFAIATDQAGWRRNVRALARTLRAAPEKPQEEACPDAPSAT